MEEKVCILLDWEENNAKIFDAYRDKKNTIIEMLEELLAQDCYTQFYIVLKNPADIFVANILLQLKKDYPLLQLNITNCITTTDLLDSQIKQMLKDVLNNANSVAAFNSTDKKQVENLTMDKLINAKLALMIVDKTINSLKPYFDFIKDNFRETYFAYIRTK